MECFDLVVVGAGVSGLALALACERQGLRVVVLERDKSRSFRQQGYFLMLPDECVNALVLRCGVDPGGAHPQFLVDFDSACKMPLVQAIPESSKQFGARSGGAIPRGPLRKKMLDACMQRGVDVRFDSFVVGLEGTRFTTAVLENGRKVSGRCLAGCDGIHSRVRRYLAPEARPEACGAICLRGYAADDGSVRALLKKTPAGDGQPATLCGVATSPGLGMNMTMVGGKITWVVEFQHSQPESLDLMAAWRKVDAATEDLHPSLRKLLLQDTKRDALYMEVLRDLGRWTGPFGLENATFLGDAAHPSVWFGGGGRGIIDAVKLADVLGGAPLQMEGLALRLREAEAAMQKRAPAEESALKWRQRLSSATSQKRIDAFHEAQASRLQKWRAQSSARGKL